MWRWFPGFTRSGAEDNVLQAVCMCVEDKIFAWDIGSRLKHKTLQICGMGRVSVRLQVQCVNPVKLRRTGLRRPLHQFVGESADAFGWDGGQGEGVLCVGLQTLHCVRIPWPEGQLLLWEWRKRSRGQGERWDEGSGEKKLKESWREKGMRTVTSRHSGAGLWG